MGYLEAKEDGIKSIGSDYVDRRYIIPCHKCGGNVTSYSYIRGRNYTCQLCKTKKTLADKECKIEQSHDIKLKKLNIAISRISKMTDINKYDYAIERVKSKLDNYGWFDSTEEIMAAIELIRKGIKARHQVKMGSYRADFLLPDEKIVLEVDGSLFHTEKTTVKEQLRDSLICLALGTEWEVIRIEDTYINENITKLVPAIRKLKKQRQAQRRLNNGQLMEKYTRVRT